MSLSKQLPEVALGLSLIALALVDMTTDAAAGASWSHLLLEGLVAGLAAVGVLALGARLRRLALERLRLSRALASSREEADRWRREAEAHLRALSVAIEEQFARWELTEAEADIAFRLLEGRSHKQIASRRGTSERTVRQQAHSIYRKAGLSDRADLAAFFLAPLSRPPQP